MPASSGCLVREAQPGVDDEAIADLMVDYLTWAIDRLAERLRRRRAADPSIVGPGQPGQLPPADWKATACRVRRSSGRCRRATHARCQHGGIEAHVCRACLAKSTSGLRNP